VDRITRCRDMAIRVHGGAYGTPILGVTLGPNLGVFPLEQTRHVGVAKSEHPRLTNGKIIFEEFQPMWSQLTNVTDGQTDRRHAIAIPRFALKCIAR